ncbi:MAG: type VI secretion system tube protein Hcp [Lacibacter sp.]
MRTILFAMLFLPFFSLAQKTETYLKLINPSGTQMKGDAVARGFERCIYIINSSQGGKNNTQITFKMNISGASADLMRARNNGEILPSGEISTIRTAVDRNVLISQIKMEKITVIAYAENGTEATVTIQATKIGWIYYQQLKGRTSVTNKYSYDAETGGTWTGF